VATNSRRAISHNSEGICHTSHRCATMYLTCRRMMFVRLSYKR